MTPTWDDFVDERGGLLMAYTGTIRDAYFQDGKYGTQLYVEVRMDHPEDHPHIPEGVVKNWFGLGKGWTTRDNGATVTYSGDPRKDGSMPTKFNGNTMGGRLCTQMQRVDPDGKTLSAGTPMEADYWRGLGHVRWDAVNVPKREQQTDGSYKDIPGGRDVSMPVGLLGDPSANGVADLDLTTLGLDEATIATLQQLGQTAKDYSGFVTAAVPALAGNPVLSRLTNAVEGPRIYDAVRNI